MILYVLVVLLKVILVLCTSMVPTLTPRGTNRNTLVTASSDSSNCNGWKQQDNRWHVCCQCRKDYTPQHCGDRQQQLLQQHSQLSLEVVRGGMHSKS